MKNRLDFAKIADGQYGALNFNNMFAISKTWLEPLDLKITEKDSLAQKQYKNLLKNQIRWCISNAQQIYKKASKLRKFYNKKRLPKPFLDRCCNFPNSEKNVEHFIQESEESL